MSFPGASSIRLSPNGRAPDVKPDRGPSPARPCPDPFADVYSVERSDSGANLVGVDSSSTFAKPSCVVAQAARSWSWAAVLVLAMICSLAVVNTGLTGAVLQYQKDTHVDNGRLLSATDGSLVQTRTSFSALDINSEMSVDLLANLRTVSCQLGAATNTSVVTFFPTGFATTDCHGSTCTSPHILQIFTTEGTLVYHGQDMFVASPSAQLEAMLGAHGVAQVQGQRHLQWWRVLWQVVNVASNAYSAANNAYSAYSAYKSYRGRGY